MKKHTSDQIIKLLSSDDYNLDILDLPKAPLKKVIHNREELEGYYMDDNGNIYSTKRSKFHKLKHRINGSKNYPYLNISVRGKRKTVTVHRLVAETFYPDRCVKEAYRFTDKQWKSLKKYTRHKIENTMTVNHIDSNTKNFSPENLEWLTQEENNNHYNRKYAKNEY